MRSTGALYAGGLSGGDTDGAARRFFTPSSLLWLLHGPSLVAQAPVNHFGLEWSGVNEDGRGVTSRLARIHFNRRGEGAGRGLSGADGAGGSPNVHVELSSGHMPSVSG